jgi:hypothetical protein
MMVRWSLMTNCRGNVEKWSWPNFVYYDAIIGRTEESKEHKLYKIIVFIVVWVVY